jgi:AraC family transcriptional regulator
MAVLLSASCHAWPQRFARVRDYIEHNLGEAISLEDLARVAGISRFHFARQFRARTGESPMGYLVRTRVERAKALLRDSQARVADISAELGFADQSHFTRTFRRMVGVPPSAYVRRGLGSDAQQRHV